MKLINFTKEELCLISIALNAYQMELDTIKKDLESNVFKSSEEQEEIAGETEIEAQAEETPAEPVEEPAEDDKEV